MTTEVIYTNEYPESRARRRSPNHHPVLILVMKRLDEK
jgi:hypothetical protein